MKPTLNTKNGLVFVSIQNSNHLRHVQQRTLRVDVYIYTILSTSYTSILRNQGLEIDIQSEHNKTDKNKMYVMWK